MFIILLHIFLIIYINIIDTLEEYEHDNDLQMTN